jgi:hypothetical protein
MWVGLLEKWFQLRLESAKGPLPTGYIFVPSAGGKARETVPRYQVSPMLWLAPKKPF